MGRKRSIATLAPISVAFAFMAAVNVLPPDSSAADVTERGRLRVCMPAHMPPFVTGAPEKPGLDVELLTKIAGRMGIALAVVTKPDMGQSYNPRSWKITRAQCDLLAGGLVLSDETRNFLSTTDPIMASGWALIARNGTTLVNPEGPIGFMPSGAGHSRLALGKYLREIDVRALPLNSEAQLRSALTRGEIVGAIVDRHLAAELARQTDLNATTISGAPEQFEYGFGFWKGDETLKRAIFGHLEALGTEGRLAEIALKYDIDPSALCFAEGASC